MSLVHPITSWFVKQRIPGIDYFKSNPLEVQQKSLLNLLHTARDTEYGKKHGFSQIRSYADFRDSLPVIDYDTLKPAVERLMKGERNIMWPGRIRWFAKSSGTTSDKSKYIPISSESLKRCHYRAGRDVMALYCHHHPRSKVFEGKGLVMGGSHNVSELNNKTYVGDLSAVLLQNSPFYAEIFRTPTLSLALIDNWEKKLDRIARATARQNVTNFSGVPSWNLILLRRILEITGREHMLEVWPNLELFIHGGVSFSPYRRQFENLIPSGRMHYLETYNASEGFFGIQDRPDANDMLLMLDYGIFYEFIPLEEFGKEHPLACSLGEVEKDRNYAMVISTNGGLWRYVIGDTVRFTSLSPYRIRISGRTKNFINAFGEEVIIDNAEKALDEACRQTSAVISEYTAAPIYLDDQASAAHEYLIEFEIPPNDLEGFAGILDSELKNLNSDYEAKRSGDLMLKRPKVRSVPEKTFFRWLKSKGKIGGQNKVPRLYNNRKYVDEILAFLEKDS